MHSRSTYVFGAAVAGITLGGIPGLLDRADAALITQAAFTFETSGVPLNAANVTASSVGPLVAESGTGSAFGNHFFTATSSTTSNNLSPTATVFSSPVGNGSARSFSSNHWGSGDYYLFNVPTTGIQDIVLSFDTTASGTGPKAFRVDYTIDGTNFVSASSYTVLTTPPWSASTSNAAFNVLVDLSAITTLNNNANAAFRVFDTDTTTATAGTYRVDNVVVAGNTVPEPAALTLLSVAGIAALRRRRAV